MRCTCAVFSIVMMQATVATVFAQPDAKVTADVTRLVNKLSATVDAKEKVAAINSLGKFGEDAKLSSRVMCKSLLDKSPLVRKAAEDAIVLIDPKLAPHVIEIASLSDNVFGDVEQGVKRSNARTAIKALGVDGNGATPVLLLRLQQNFEDVTAEYQKLGKKPAASYKELAIIEDMEALAAIAPKDPAVFKAIKTISATAPTPKIKNAAIAAIETIKPKK